MSKFNPDQIQRGDLPTELTRLSKRIDESERSSNLRHSSIGSGGITVRDQGNIRIEDGGDLVVDGGDINVTSQGRLMTYFSSGNVATMQGRYSNNQGFAVLTDDAINRGVIYIGRATDGRYGIICGDVNVPSDHFAATTELFVIRLVNNGLLYMLNLPTTSNPANLHVFPSGAIGEVTSSIKYKEEVEDAEIDPEKVLQMRPRTWRDKNAIEDKDKRHIGFIAEELVDIGLSEFVGYKDGEPDSIAYDRISAALVELAKAQHNRINELEERLNRMEERMSKLEGEDS